MPGFGALIATVLVDVPQSFLFDVDVTGTLGMLIGAVAVRRPLAAGT